MCIYLGAGWRHHKKLKSEEKKYQITIPKSTNKSYFTYNKVMNVTYSNCKNKEKKNLPSHVIDRFFLNRTLRT